MLCLPALCFQYPEFLYRSLGFAFYGRRGLLLLKQQIFRRSKGMARFPCRAAAFCWCANEDNSGHWVCCDRARSAFGQACASMEKPCFIIPWLFSFLFAFTAWYRYSGIIDFTRSDEIGAPWNLWVLFGSHDKGGDTEIYKDTAFAAAFPTMEERSAAIWKRIFENYRSYSFSEFLELLRNKLLFAWNNSMFESSEYLLWPIDSNWTFYITQPQFLPTQLIRAYSTIYMLFLYAANILSAGVGLFRKKINFTFIPNLFVFGTMLYLLIFENAPRRAMIAVPFMIYNVIFLLSQWRDKPDGAQLAERFRMRIHKN